MERLAVRLEKSGRILIPVAVRRRLGLKDGESEVLLEIHDEQPIGLTTRARALDQIQAEFAKHIMPGRLLSEELIAERREEAQREFEPR